MAPLAELPVARWPYEDRCFVYAMRLLLETGSAYRLEEMNWRQIDPLSMSRHLMAKLGSPQNPRPRDRFDGVDDALRYGRVTAQGANGFKIEHNACAAIGTNQAGGAASSIRSICKGWCRQDRLSF